MSIHVDTAPDSVATRTFFLYIRSDLSRGLRCDTSGSNTTCDSGAQTFTIPPGSPLLMDGANTGNAPPMKVQFNWRATTQ